MAYRDGAAWSELDTFGEEEEIDDNEYRYATRDHILFCIDAAAAMRVPVDVGAPEGGDKSAKRSPLHMALEVVLRVQRGKVLSGPNDSVGVLLWNVDASKEALTIPARKKGEADVVLENFRPGCYLFQALRPISADEIKRVKAFLDEADEQAEADPEEEPGVLSSAFPPIAAGKELDIADVFECCNHVIRDAGTSLAGQKRVFLITNDERPERGDAFVDGRDTRNPARTRFLDLSSLGVQVDPFFIGREGTGFDEDAYWNDILLRDTADTADADDDADARIASSASTAGDGLAKLRELMEEQVTRTSTKRVLFSVPLVMGGSRDGKGQIMISVHGYSMYAETKKPGYRYYDLSGRAAEEVRTKTTYVSANTGESVSKEQIGYAYPFGKTDAASELYENYWERTTAKKETGGASEGKKQDIRTRIAFRDEEIKQFKTMGMIPQIKIIGFYDPSNLDFAHNIKHSVFIYPNEKIFSGSTRTFAALLASCAKRNRYGLALCMFRANSTPVFCCMVPQIETLLPNGHQDLPPGFHLVPLPYTDDIRARPEKVTDAVQACSKEQRDKMLTVVNKLRMRQRSYEPGAYPNPSLAYFYSKLQSLAFEEEFFDPLAEEDKTAPLTIGMHKVAGNLMQDFIEEVDGDVRVQYSTAMPKKKRAAPGDDDVDDGFIEGYWKNGKLEKLTVPNLKAYCTKHGLSTEGKKADLLRTVQAHFDAGGGSSAKKPKM